MEIHRWQSALNARPFIAAHMATKSTRQRQHEPQQRARLLLQRGRLLMETAFVETGSAEVSSGSRGNAETIPFVGGDGRERTRALKASTPP